MVLLVLLLGRLAAGPILDRVGWGTPAGPFRVGTTSSTGGLNAKTTKFLFHFFSGGPISASSDPDCFHSFPATGLDTGGLYVVSGWSLPGGITAASALLLGIQTLAMNHIY